MMSAEKLDARRVAGRIVDALSNSFFGPARQRIDDRVGLSRRRAELVPSAEAEREFVEARIIEAQIELLERINAAAEADMLKGNPISGAARHRQIEAELARLRKERDATD